MSLSDKKLTILRDKQTVITRAIFWKVERSDCNEIHLKLGRYKKPKFFLDSQSLENETPKSELTLDHEEMTNLMNFLQAHYEHFKIGEKEYIPIPNDINTQAKVKIQQLINNIEISDLIEILIENQIDRHDLELSISYTNRLKAIDEFNQLLEYDETENVWQKWFENNSWVLGSDFVKTIDERSIDTRNISDFLMQSYDGFIDIVEIKRPDGNLKFWQSQLDHGNYIPHSDLIKAITQSLTYIHEIEQESNSVKFLERTEHIKTIKPRCTLIYGRSNDWNKDQIKAFRILNSSYHNLSVITFDHGRIQT
ncbi:Shedu immune nuclease family protein [Acinetobacter colistiniresistens]|uniref:Shedu immune nuclease family protein n=1 Tax=Acinetobacter colistiniresistens TaxID=280145 RepID=UPI00148F41EA|nr:Shedu immune nuclease family protein [Acinetobacter colistiniresistens]